MMDASLALVFGSTPYTFPACMATAHEGTSQTTRGCSADLALTKSVLFNQMGGLRGQLSQSQQYEYVQMQGSNESAAAAVGQQRSRAAAASAEQQRVGTVVEVGVRVHGTKSEGAYRAMACPPKALNSTDAPT